jgi:hypothetical protein
MSVQVLAGKTFVVGIGAQKAGTTWLHAYLLAHPEVAIPPIKELHYWDQLYRPDLCGDWNQRFARQLGEADEQQDEAVTRALSDRLRMTCEADYMRFFASRVPPGAKAFGEITPSYALLPVEGFARLRAQHESVKVIYILRDPVARFWSGVVHEARTDPSVLAVAEFDVALSDPRHVERTRYDLTLQRLDAVFDERDIAIEFYETLFTEPAIERISRAIGIEPRPAAFGWRVNVSRDAPPLTPRRAEIVRERFATVYDYCRRRFGARVPSSWVA